MIVPAGGLDEDMAQWINSKKDFFLPEKVLSKIFRGILYRLLEEAVDSQDIILPKRFCKIRYFGYLALRNTKTKLENCRNLIAKPTSLSTLEGISALEVIRNTTGVDLLSCPNCKSGRMLINKKQAIIKAPG